MRRVEVFPYAGKYNSLHLWWKVKNPIKTVFNFILINAAKFAPSLSLKNFIYRLTGMKIGKGVAVSEVMFDFFFPELIEIGDGTIIGYNTTTLSHEFLVKEWRTGKVKIGKRVMIGANCLIMPGVEIGDNATVAAFSLVNKDIPPKQVWGGVPCRKIR